MDGERGQGWRRIRLLCPSLSKVVQIMAWDEQKLDLGSIARAFGVDPNTLKLNGHFISRGADLVASSVTWKSLIGFFTSRGLSTGATDSDALLVDGKLAKIGSKRSHEQEDAESRMVNAYNQGYSRDAKRPHLRCCSLLNKSVLGNSVGSKLDCAPAIGRVGGIKQTTEWSGSNSWGLKRKLQSEDESQFKRKKHDAVDSGETGPSKFLKCEGLC